MTCNLYPDGSLLLEQLPQGGERTKSCHSLPIFPFPSFVGVYTYLYTTALHSVFISVLQDRLGYAMVTNILKILMT